MSVFKQGSKGGKTPLNDPHKTWVPDETVTGGVPVQPAPARRAPDLDMRLEQGQTRLIGPEGADPGGAEGTGMTDPVVGWVVIVEGPGRGHFQKLGYGMNRIGRGSDCRVRLDFGDEEMSREGHCAITCDPKTLRFFIQHMGGVNLTYLGEESVLAPTDLVGGERISLGGTVLMFVRFCGSDFDWQTRT